MTVFVYEADGSDIAFKWEEDSNMTLLGHTAISAPNAQTITWTAPPELPNNSKGEIFSVFVVVTDDQGNQEWVFDEISVYPDPVEQSITEIINENSGGCAGSPAWLLLPLAGAFRRRRKNRQ